MANYVLDTGILVGYLRGAAYAERVNREYAPTQSPNIAVISIVTAAELDVFSLRSNWGEKKKHALRALLAGIPSVPIAHPALVSAFSEVRTFSQGHHPARKLHGSARTMGDNDTWIAATAKVLNATLVTTDHDFDHLNGEYFRVVYIDPK